MDVGIERRRLTKMLGLSTFVHHHALKITTKKITEFKTSRKNIA